MKTAFKITSLATAFALALASNAFAQPTESFNKPPKGFTALFNGADLSGWRGGDTKDHRWLMGLPEDKRAEQLQKWTDDMKRHWKVENGELLNDGNGAYATTEKEYGDFELLVDYNMAPKGDSGVYLRNVPQVQIWDPTMGDGGIGRSKGSGGLWNNSPGAPGKDPLVLADKPAGEWNRLRVVMVGSRVSVWLNDKMTVDHAILENYYDRKTPIPARGPICLQTHGAPIRWRNVFLREIGSEEANKILAAKGSDGFQNIFNGTDFTGWAGPTDNYEIVDGALRCKAGKGGTIYWNEDLTDFVARLEFKIPPGGNNGLAIRYPGTGDTAYVGMTELQILDDNYEKVRGAIDPKQVHGSAYGMAGAFRGYQHPISEWNFQEVTVKGSTLKVELNGTVILNTDLAKLDPATFLGAKAHPGQNRTNGFFGFAGHSDPVAFRNVQIKKLP
jgi:hypothetical protein